MSEKEDKKDEKFSRKARDRLSGALSSAFDKSEHLNNIVAAELLDGIPDLTAGLDSPLKRIINSSSPWNSPTKSPRTTRRRRKKDVPHDQVFHHTFVLKLFDRSLDLAQFEAGTPLYSVCRAWMKDQPHNRNFAPRLRTPTPEPEWEKSDDNSSDKVSSHDNNLENGEEHSEGEPSSKKARKDNENVYKMPSFQPLQNREANLRIPKLDEPKKVQNFSIQEIQSDGLNQDSLLTSHLQKWQKVRSSWREAYNKNETRYEESMNMLKNMFET